MKRDLAGLMSERDIDVAIVEGSDGTHGANPAFAYLVNGEHLVGTVILQRGKAAQLLYRSMERDAAAATGLELINLDRWPLHEILEEYPNPLDARVELYRRIFEDLKIKGKVAFYGTGSIGGYHAFLQALKTKVPGIEIVGEYDRDIFAVARETKDAHELESLRVAGQRTCEVVEAVIKFLQAHSVKNETLIQEDGKPLTIADVKEFTRLELARWGLSSAEDFIFAIGRDAGVPHSTGNSKDPLQLGKTIVFDIFPKEPGGYFHDLTRTFCLGYAPKEVERIFRDVMECFETVVGQFKAGELTQSYQHVACEFFEKRGHSTLKSNPTSQEGYVHSLGHGVGLEVHEQPYFPTFGKWETKLKEGMVFTVEPGLYYPERGFGVRIEDTYYCDESGEFHSLTPFPKDLVIEL